MMRELLVSVNNNTKIPSRPCFRVEDSGLGLRKGAWTDEEDKLLRNCIEKYGEGRWHLIPQRAGLNRCRKSCRLRWLNYLKPNIKRGQFAADEVDLIVRLHNLLGNRWSLIAGRIPGRTANDVKNYWNTNLRPKKPIASSCKQQQQDPKAAAEPPHPPPHRASPPIKKTVVIKPRPRSFSRKVPSYCNDETQTAVASTGCCNPTGDTAGILGADADADAEAVVLLSQSENNERMWWENLLNLNAVDQEDINNGTDTIMRWKGEEDESMRGLLSEENAVVGDTLLFDDQMEGTWLLH